MCAQSTKPVSKDWGGNNAAEHRISGSAGSCCALAPWGIRSLLTARYRIFPEIPVSVTLIAINLQHITGLPQVP